MKYRSRPSNLDLCPGCGGAIEQPSAVIHCEAADGWSCTIAECPDCGVVHPE